MLGNSKDCLENPPSNSKNERIKLVEKKAKEFGITVLLKGATDIISNGSTTYLNEKKTPAMTVGGTGDVSIWIGCWAAYLIISNPFRICCSCHIH